MNNKFKLPSAILSASLLVTPVSGLTNNFNNVAKANSYIKEEQKDTIYKILEPNVKINDGKIVLENKKNIKNQIINNWEKIKSKTTFKSPEELYLSLEKHFNDLENKSNQRYIEVKPNGEIKQRYQTREVWPEDVGRTFSDPNYHRQTHWWGTLHFFYTDAVAYRYAYEMNESGITQGVVAGFSSILGGFVGAVIGLNAGHALFIANTVNYNAGLPGDGVELSVKHWGEINCKPR